MKLTKKITRTVYTAERVRVTTICRHENRDIGKWTVQIETSEKGIYTKLEDDRLIELFQIEKWALKRAQEILGNSRQGK